MIYSLENENAARSTKIFHSSLVSSCAYSRSLDLVGSIFPLLVIYRSFIPLFPFSFPF